MFRKKLVEDLPVKTEFFLKEQEIVLNRYCTSVLDSFVNLCRSDPERWKMSLIDVIFAEIRKLTLLPT